MRTSKFRIVAVGAFLGLVGCGFVLVQDVSSATRERRDEERQRRAHVASAKAEAGTRESQVAAPLPEAELWNYVAPPVLPEALERLMRTPSREVYYARMDPEALSPRQSGLTVPGSRVNVTLPDGSAVAVRIERSESLGPDRYVSEGVLEGAEAGRAVFAYHEGELSAVFDDLEHGSWQVRSLGDGIAQVFKVDPVLVPPCDLSTAVPEVDPAADEPLPAAASGSGTASTLSATGPAISGAKTEIRVLMPYSKVILTAVSSGTVKNWIDLAVAAMNNDLSRSGVPVKVTLAGAPAIQYDQEWSGGESRALDDALTRVTSSTDGILDQIHVLRADAKADLVAFVACAIDSNNSGIGYILSRPGDYFNPNYGFSVVTVWHMHSSSVFSHELGHNFGCNHDRENARSTAGAALPGSHPYSYGYRFYGKDGRQYRTIMAYAPGTVVPYFSNPNLKAGNPVNVALGVQPGQANQAFNALSIAKNAAEVSSYRNSRLVVRAANRLRAK